MGLELVRGRPIRQATRPLRKSPEDAARAPVAKLSLPGPKVELRFPVGQATRAFYRRFWPGTGPAEWNDWRWQMRTRIRTLDELARIFRLSEDEYAAVSRHQGALPVGITPYYASLMGLDDAARTLAPHPYHDRRRICARPMARRTDPLGEDHDTVVPGLVHRYPDRVLFLTTGTCSTYCRYCTRSRLVGNPGGEYHFSTRQWDQAIAYLEAHTEVRDVLLVGRRSADLGRRQAGLAARPAARHSPYRIPAHRHQDAGGDAPARHTRPGPGAEETSSAVDEPAFHPSRRTDPGSGGGDRPAGRCRRSAGQPDRAAQGHQRRCRGDD